MTEAVQVSQGAQEASISTGSSYEGAPSGAIEPMVNVNSNAGGPHLDHEGAHTESGIPQNKAVELSEEAKAAQAAQSDAPAANGEWFLTEDVKGEGDAPDWLSDRYKTVADQAKAYKELEKKMGSFSGAPDEYEIESTEALEASGFDLEDPEIQGFIDMAKDSNMSNDMLNKMLNMHAEKLTAFNNVSDDDIAEYKQAELQKLGDQAPQITEYVKNFAGNNLSPEEAEILADNVDSADMLLVMKKIIDQTRNAPLVGNQANASSITSKDEARKLLANPKYGKDDAYTQWANSQYEQAYMSGSIR